jgi:hypothetical protein
VTGAQPNPGDVVRTVAEALAAACPTPDQCAGEPACTRHGIHRLSTGRDGIGPRDVLTIEGGVLAVAAVATRAALLAAADLWDLRADAIADLPGGNLGQAHDRHRLEADAREVAADLRELSGAAWGTNSSA